MIREAITDLKEAKPKMIMDYIRRRNPQVHVNESSFRADIIGCSVNHPSSHHYLGMPKFLFFDKTEGTYRLHDPDADGKAAASDTSKKVSDFTIAETNEVTDIEKTIGKKILQAFDDGAGLFREYHSEAANDAGLDNDLYLNYLTFTSAIDYQKNIEANILWKAAKEWARQYPWLFKPNELMDKAIAQVIADFKHIRERDSGIFRPQDVGIWLLIAEALHKHGGRTSRLLEDYDFDAWKIYNELSGPLKKDFPFLSGDKILPMWLKILWEDAKMPMRNMEKLPLPVDKNVAEATHNLLFRKKFNGIVNEKTIEQVRAVWKKIADRLDVPVISFDTPLWILGGNAGCSSSHQAGCTNCPVNTYCYPYTKRAKEQE